MKKKLILFTVVIISFLRTESQVLNVSAVIQEQNQWCWSGVSACILDYYNYPIEQCTVAEYTRNVATWHNFGSTDCCVNPNMGCNYWNYNWGYPGSIQDILIYFANIYNDGIASTLSEAEITSDIQNNRVFVIRWGWTSGGGHFLVGHGLIGTNLYYMNPWFGEGLKIGEYSWVCSGDNHTWTHTNRLSVTPTSVGDIESTENIRLYPNPVSNELMIETEGSGRNLKFNIIDASGQVVSKGEVSDKIMLSTEKLAPGLYLVKFDNGKTFKFEKAGK